MELALRESLQLGHHYIGTEHILLGLIREGEGVAAQVLVKLGADLNRVRQQVIQLVTGKEPEPMPVPWERTLLPRVDARLDAFERRLAAIEQRVGKGPDTGDLDEQIERVRAERQAAADAQQYEQAASLRDQERQLIARQGRPPGTMGSQTPRPAIGGRTMPAAQRRDRAAPRPAPPAWHRT